MLLPLRFWWTLTRGTVSHEIRLGQGTTLNDGLVHAYKMDETTGNRQDSVGSAHLTNLGANYYVTGKDGNAADLNAGSGGMYVSGSSIHPGTEFTYSAWISRQGSDTFYAVSIADDTGGWWLDIAGTYITFWWNQSGTVNVSALATLGTDWHLVTWWADATYIGIQIDDGAPQVALRSGKTYVPSINFEIGFNEYIDEGIGYAWDGWVDDLCAWNRALTSDERTERVGKYYPFT